MSTVTFFGAVRTVTGSMHLVETGDTRLLLDCGLFQGRRADARRVNSEFPFSPSSIDTVLLSHAHLDHCGNLPTLVQQGFRGKILCTPATRDLAALILRDSAEIQHQDVNFANKVRARQGQPPLQPLYTIDDAEQAIRRLSPVPYHQTFQVGPATGVFYDAGHILGSAVTVLAAEGRTIVFSGDPFGGRDIRYVRSVEESKELNARHDPFIVVATSGMCESGRILHHLRHHVGDPQSSLVFVSFQAADTLGRRLMDGVTPVHIFDESYEVRLQVHRIESYSAHADRDELVAWVGRMPRVGQICLVHGEEQQSTALARHLSRRGIKVTVPTRGQRITV